MIFEGSRYEYAPMIRVGTAYGEILPALYQDQRLLRRHFTFFEYVWQTGDRVDIVATRFLGDPERWWEIMLANPEITDPDKIEANEILRIPRA